MAEQPRTTITLRALTGAPLADQTIRRMVTAAAHAIAERHGVDLLHLRAEDDRITATLACPRLAAIGFAAELRRITEHWYRARSGNPTLWGEPPPTPSHPDLDEPEDEDWGLGLDDWKDADQG